MDAGGKRGLGARRPNLVVLLTDDQGCWALGCAGNPELRTPNLDRLAATGLRFENFFCASPVCSPARASLLTGRMPSQHGIHDWIREGNVDGGGDRAIEYLRGLTAYPESLASAGYVCGLSGKWHLGDSLHPQKGFTHWFVHQSGGGSYYGAPMIREGRCYQEPRYVTDAITDDALEFLTQQRCAAQPFYLSVHYTAPHSPWDAGQHPADVLAGYRDCPFVSCPDVPVHPWQVATAPRGTGALRRELLAGYFAAITAMDRNVGRILDAIEAGGMREDTLILFTSDNGMNMGHHGLFGKGNATFPQNMYDTSVKVPAIVSLPGRVAEGAVEQGLFSHYDVMPTLLDWLGLAHPDAARLPGISFAPLLRGEGMACRDHVVVCDEYGPVRMVRDRRWKYVQRGPGGPNELYDLAADPDEACNLAQETAARQTVAALRGQLDEFFARYADPARDGVRQPVGGTGQRSLVGPPGSTPSAFFPPAPYVDADGQPRGPDYRHAGAASIEQPDQGPSFCATSAAHW